MSDHPLLERLAHLRALIISHIPGPLGRRAMDVFDNLADLLQTLINDRSSLKQELASEKADNAALNQQITSLQGELSTAQEQLSAAEQKGTAMVSQLQAEIAAETDVTVPGAGSDSVPASDSVESVGGGAAEPVV